MSNIALEGNTSGTGTLTIAAPNTNTDRTLTLPDSAGEIFVGDIASADLPAGSVLQVVHGSDTSALTSTTVGSDVDLGLSATITPTSSSSKILVVLTIFVGYNPNGGYYLKRGSTKIGGVGVSGGANQDTSNFYNTDDHTHNVYSVAPINFNYLDSPATTSATTYEVGFRSNAGSAQICYNRIYNNTSYRSRSVITLIEVAA